ncbi:ribosomal L28 family-domain-containing protein [Pyrenochaeta sp. MPI-SDFR-AT-0127]|nr:ribosomal L28 family-domain-containing protein [Pyrenochaeta sp. MPI-SDFR-AT-0127]
MHPRCQLLSGRLSANGLAFRAAQSTQRAYATSTPSPTPSPPVKNPLQRRRGGDLGSHLPKHVIPKDAYIPAYPYGDHALFKQANKGLYGEQMIQFGNNVSEETETKTRRNWKPNVLSKSLYSVALKKRIKLRITAKVLKTIDREGGLDEYLLRDNEHRIKELGPMGWALRWTLMQKPEVIARLRTDAAALGIDQATIDKQWPTPQMMAQQNAAQAVIANAFQHEGFGETEAQEMWAPEETEAGPDGDSSLALSKPERKAAANAAIEYNRAVKAAQRYLSRGLVDSEEEGLKLAFVRAKERTEARSRLQQDFKTKVGQQFNDEHVQEIRTRFNLPNIKDRTARKIAYNQWKRQQIEEAGGYDAWKETFGAEKAAARAAMIEEAGGPEAWQANRKAMYAQLIEEAETASTNENLDAERRSYLETAINKADRAIKATAAGGHEDYVDLTLEELRQSRSASLLSQASTQGNVGDAWAALISSSNRSADSRLNA